MAENEIFLSSLRARGDKAGVFEIEDGIGYFYLYDTGATDENKVLGAIRIVRSEPEFEESDIEIFWDHTETKVGLIIKGQPWAVFDAETYKTYGGDYRAGGLTNVSSEIASLFLGDKGPS